MKNKTLTLKQFIQYRNMLLVRRDARKKNFPEKITYYDIRIKELNELYPEFSNFGKINLK